MGYKPKYCCECGDKIEENLNRNLLASSRFCQLCETNFKLEDWMPRVILGLGLFFGIVGIGGYFLNHEPAANLAVKQSSANLLKANIESADRDVLPNKISDTDEMQAALVEDVQNKAEVEPLETPVIGKVKVRQPRIEQKNADLPVYFCGAQTKKGTACSRKVRGGGRCWQHEGREAMMPQKDLLISP